MLAPTAHPDERRRREPPKATSTTEIETLLELGQGGMATAYLGRALGTAGFERLVVLKRLNGELAGHRDAIRRFLAEARVAARLHHANVVGTHQIGWDGRGPFIVLDYVEGGSLADLVDTALDVGERLPVGVVLRVALDVLAGLCAVHEARDGDGRPLAILHRDVSLENVLVGVSDGVARLSDFGVAKSVLGPSLTDPGCFVGKVLYFAPEYLLREPVGPTLDLYAVGVALWLALTGDELWPGKTDGELARAIVEEGVPSLEGRRDVAPEIRDLVARACAPEARSRFQSAREMLASLQHFERKQGTLASHAEVASCVERLLGARLRERRATLARLVPELASAGASGEPLELRATIPASRRGPERGLAEPDEPGNAPSSATRQLPRRRLAHVLVPAGFFALAALLTSPFWHSPERPPGAPHVVASESFVGATPGVAAGDLGVRATLHPAQTAVPARVDEPLVVPSESASERAIVPIAAARHRAPAQKRPAPAPSASSDGAREAGESEIARKNPYR
jgi:serine/threonine-protein kinase